jgi:hypothetical protein
VWLLGDSWVLYALRPAGKGQYLSQGEAYLDSIYEGSSADPDLHGTGKKYIRRTTGGATLLVESLKGGGMRSPFLELYDLNPDKIQTVELV